MNNLVRVSVAFTDPSNGNPVDPSVVTLYYRWPGGQEQTITNATRDGVGLYHYDINVQAPGVWLYRWEGSGTVEAATSDIPFQVQGSSLVTA